MKEQCKASEIISLGHYPQSRANNFEPVEWKVLKIDGEKAFVTSVYALDAQPFNAVEEQLAVPEDQTLRELIPAGFNDTTWENLMLLDCMRTTSRKTARQEVWAAI